MTELDPGVHRAADRLYERLITSRHDFVEALLSLVPIVEEAARNGDTYARHLLDEVERTRSNMVADSIEVGEILAGW